jgi:uncharacterized membrane protein YgcG
MAIIPLLVGFGVLLYLFYLIVSLLKDWYGIVGETITAGKQKHETSGRIALDIAEEAGIGAAKVAAGYAVGALVGSAIGGAAAKGAGGGLSAGGGTFGGGGAAGSW